MFLNRNFMTGNEKTFEFNDFPLIFIKQSELNEVYIQKGVRLNVIVFEAELLYFYTLLTNNLNQLEYE